MVQQQRIQKLIDKLLEFNSIHFHNSFSELVFSINFENEIPDALPFLKKFFSHKNCPVNHVFSEYSRIMELGLLTDILTDNTTVTTLNITDHIPFKLNFNQPFNVIRKLCNYIQKNKTIKTFAINTRMMDYVEHILASVAESSIVELDLSGNWLNYTTGNYFQEILPTLKIKTLNLKKNNTNNVAFQNRIISGIRHNIFLQKLYIDDLSPENRQKLEQTLLINRFIQKSFQIYLKNYGPKRLGILGKIDGDTFIQLSRDPTKPKPLDRDVRTYISQFIPRTIQKGGFEYFLLWMENVQKCIRSPTKHPIGELVSTAPHVQFFQRNSEMLKKAIQKLGLYAKSNNIVRTGGKSPFTNLSFGQTQKRGRKRKSSQINQ